MQLHLTPFSVQWHSGGDNSELSMQWGHISRHYSTDHSSSVGSMESLEIPPNQGYYDRQLSPIDTVIFNNKRDSAYSSFSASSNTSDYTVSVKPEEANSMDNLLGSSSRCPDGGQHSVPSSQRDVQEKCESLQSKMLSHGPEVKVRPSSYSCENERFVPPQPPMRKDSFRATRSQAGVKDKRCVSAPVGIPDPASFMTEDQPPIQEVSTANVYLNGKQDSEHDLKGSSVEPYYTFIAQKKSSRDRQPDLENQSKSAEMSPPPLNSFLEMNTDEHFDTQLQPEQNLQPAVHRHSAPEKLLASQLSMMDFSSEKHEQSASPTCQWSQSPLYLNDISPDMAQSKWVISRCSTPGSLSTSELEEPRLEEEALESGQSMWGQSANVSENPTGNKFSEHGSINHAVRVDIPPNENFGEESRVNDGEVSKPSQKRQFRNSKSRRRSERFATNLRNEIQRKKAQLQKSRNSGGLPCDEEMVEEEVADLNTESESNQHRAQTFTTPLTNPPAASMEESTQKPQGVLLHDTTHTEEHPRTNIVSCQASQTQTQISQHSRQVCVRVVEELAPAGKPRRWRWTPEQKLQPETLLPNQTPTESKGNESAGQTWSGRTGMTRGRTTSSSGRLGRSDECDIPPFADRRRFFEETSRKLSQSVTNLSGFRTLKPDRLCRQNHPSSPEPPESATHLNRRRFSYQGVVQDGPYMNSLDTGGHFLRVQRDQEIMREMVQKEREMEKVREIEKEREREREQERIREQEKLREEEREKERLRREREKEQQRQEWEDRQRRIEWESERETVQSKHSNRVPHSSSHDVYWKQPSSAQIPSCHQIYSNTATNSQKHCSAFHPVTGQHSSYDGHPVHPPYKTRSYTLTEVHPPREQEPTKLNRMFSLTERDYRCRSASRTAEGAVAPTFIGQNSQSAEERPVLFSPLRNRAMSENDLRVETQNLNYIPNTVSRTRASTLGDLDENKVGVGEVKQKKGPPPPRPPPPKWEEFHKRRMSHHNLFSSPSSSPPRPQCTSRPPSVPEMTRQRSYSLPPREVPENRYCCCKDESVAPPSPACTRRTFKPVAPPPRERAITPHNYDRRREFIQPEPCTRIPVHTASMSKHESRSTFVKPIFHEHQAEWDRSSPHHSAAQIMTRCLEVPENSSSVSPESYFSMNNNQLQPQPVGFLGVAHKIQNSYSQSPASVEDENVPIETDIDEICETERAGEVDTRETEGKMEMQGFARPVIVLETDLDNMPEDEAPSTRNTRGTRGSLVDSILEEDYGISRRELMGDLFPQSAETETVGESWRGGHPISGGTLERSSRPGTSTAQVPWSTSYDTLPDNSKLLAKMREISERKEEEEELNYKKQLMESLRKKLGVLREAQRDLQEDIRANSQLGEEVERLVLAICKPNEVDKYRMFIGDLDKVTSLLLSLSGRLLRVESALDCVDSVTGHHERLQLLEKKKQLLVQLGEAQELKEHVDQREQAVGRVLARCLTPEQMRDYSHFVKMKAALLVEQRQLDDKIRLGEEQLRGLRESLGMGLGYGCY